MLTTLRHSEAHVAVILWMTLAGLLALLAAPCGANVAPESALLVHVQPAQPVSFETCQIPITDCHQITRSTSADGRVEFVIFFMNWLWPGQRICIQSLHNVLSWPAAWQLVEFHQCPGGIGSLDPSGATHALDLNWSGADIEISDLEGGVIPVARLVMNVAGPGRLEIVGGSPVVLRRNCFSPTFVTYPVQIYAEAGIQCGYVLAHCGYSESGCEARFAVPDLHLRAPSGGAADSTVDFWAVQWYNPDGLCPMTIDTHALWCTAWVDPVYEYWVAHLHVSADAAGLAPGLYETEIVLSSANPYWPAARCLPVEFTVEENTVANSTVSWGRISSLSLRWNDPCEA